MAVQSKKKYMQEMYYKQTKTLLKDIIKNIMKVHQIHRVHIKLGMVQGGNWEGRNGSFKI